MVGCSVVISTSISEFDEVSSRSLSLISITSSSMRGNYKMKEHQRPESSDCKTLLFVNSPLFHCFFAFASMASNCSCVCALAYVCTSHARRVRNPRFLVPSMRLTFLRLFQQITLFAAASLLVAYLVFKLEFCVLYGRTNRAHGKKRAMRSSGGTQLGVCKRHKSKNISINKYFYPHVSMFLMDTTI